MIVSIFTSDRIFAFYRFSDRDISRKVYSFAQTAPSSVTVVIFSIGNSGREDPVTGEKITILQAIMPTVTS